VVVTGVDQTREMIRLFGAADTKADQEQVSPTKLVPGKQPITRSSARYLFGKHTDQQKSITLTNSSLTLNGVFVSDDPKTAAAVIAENDNPEELYTLGDKVPGGGVLDQVLSDRVILKRNGRLETLLILQYDVKNRNLINFKIPNIEPKDLDIDYNNPEQLRNIKSLRSKILKGYGLDKMLDNPPKDRSKQFKYDGDFGF